MTRRKRLLQELDEDIRDHLDRETQDNYTLLQNGSRAIQLLFWRRCICRAEQAALLGRPRRYIGDWQTSLAVVGERRASRKLTAISGIIGD
jgi:hypothetical protein